MIPQLLLQLFFMKVSLLMTSFLVLFFSYRLEFLTISFSVELHPSVGENLCPYSCWRIRSLGARSWDSAQGIVCATTSIIEPQENAN